MDVGKKTDQPMLLVGIGTSAGGLPALKNFFHANPAHPQLTFVVVQHLDPNHKSMLADILSRETILNVYEAENGQKLAPNSVYIIPPDALIEVEGHHIKIIKPHRKHGSRSSIDHLFRAMAENFKAQGIGILLSGSGSDGTAGLRALKAAGGLSIVQDPRDAEYSSMPRSAIDAGVVDVVCNIEDMPQVLLDYVEHPYVEYQEESEADEKGLQSIAALLKTRENFDLQQYKESTVERRILRRMSLTGKRQKEDYIQLLRSNGDERGYLMQDLLINVTDFFRDQNAFKILEDKVVQDIIESADPGSDIRIWVAGCASGEEAYSLGILFLEGIKKANKDLDLKIFATDVDEEAIKIARKGLYPASIMSEVPADYLNTYFTTENDQYYRVKTHLRDKISFATQNVYSDPPFSKMDLISCRNLLIYLRKKVQSKALQSFYFALNEQGYLFLGSSENIGEQKQYFQPISNKWRIFQKKPAQHTDFQVAQLGRFVQPKYFKKNLQTRQKKSDQYGPIEQAKEILLQNLSPSVLINGDNQVLYFHGDTHPYLKMPDGEPKLDFIKMLDSKLRTRVRSAIFKARQSNEKINIHCPPDYRQSYPNQSVFLISVSPVSHQALDKKALIISFKPDEDLEKNGLVSASSTVSGDQENMVAAMERDLQETRKELQNTVEELETSTEELKASHEEALSTNEELQSTNEELEASTEELRSLNEELTTVNSQLKEKIDALQSAHDDIENFFASTNLATIFLCVKFKLMRYTPAAQRLLRLGPQDIGHPISDISRDLMDEETIDEAKKVIQSLESSEKEIQSGQRWFVRKILPYRTGDQRIAGVVITFNDVSELKKANHFVEIREKQHAVIAKLGMEALKNQKLEELIDHTVREVAYVLDADYCKFLKYQPTQKNFLLQAGVGWQKGAVGKETVIADSTTQAGYTLKENEPVIVEDLNTEKRFAGPKLLVDHHVVSGMSCVVSKEHECYGVLSVHTQNKKIFTKDDANFLRSISNLLSVSIHRKKIEQAIKESEEKLRIAKDSNNMGYFEYSMIDGETHWDNLIKRLWGLKEDEQATQELFSECLHPDDRKKTLDAIEKSMDYNGSGHYHTTYRVINKLTQKISWVEASGQVMFKDQMPQKMIGMVIDITKQKETENTLENAIINLEAAHEKKNQFLATLGHELRNPLAAINSGVQIMQMDKSKADWALNMMAHNVKLVSSLLDDLLDLTRISRGKIKLKKEVLNLNDILSETLQGFARDAEKKELKMTSHLTSEPIYVKGDQTRLDQIFSNLICNALKFTPAGGNVSVHLIQKSGRAWVTVNDDGIGIDPKKLNLIFQPFEQITDKKLQNPGLGIGLALVSQLVNLHGGSIKAESQGKDKGTTLSVDFPISDEIVVPARKKVKKPDIKKDLKVLIVDDNVDAVKGLKSILAKEKCRVYSAYTAKGALKKVEKFSPEVFIIDIGLPDGNGHDLLRDIKTKYKESATYIALTGYSHEEAHARSKQAGFDFHLNKPAMLDDLLGILGQASHS